MHRCLGLIEMTILIFETALIDSTRTVLALALKCHYLCEPALRILWPGQTNPLPLLKCFPSNIGTISASGGSPWGVSVLPIMMLQRISTECSPKDFIVPGPQSHDWDHVTMYASFIEKLDLMPPEGLPYISEYTKQTNTSFSQSQSSPDFPFPKSQMTCTLS